LGSKQPIKKPKPHRKLGKVDALLNEKLEKVEWGEFKLGELFIKKTIKGVPKNEENLKPNKDGYHMFGQNIKYQYLQKIKLENKYLQEVDSNYPILAYTSSVGEIGLIKESFYRSGDNGAFQGLFPISYKFNIKELQFIESIIKKQFDFFGYGTAMSNIMELKIHLPTKNGEIDFAFMESFIAEIEERRIKELEAERMQDLEAYLQVTGLKDYTLTVEEQKVLGDFENGKIAFKQFKIGELFDINSYKKRFDANKVVISEVGKPYVVRTSLNNGIRGYINEDEEYLNDGNTISFGQDTATMFYQEKPYFTGDKIKIVKSKDDKFNKLNALFFITTMTKTFSAFSWGSSSFSVKIIENQEISLPVAVPPSGVSGLDYALMETLISAIQKLVIKEVVLYADRKIAATKSVVNN